MSDLVVVGFKGDKSRASDALNKLRDLDFRWVIDLEGAVAMYRDDDGKLHLRQDPEMTTGEGVRWGGVIGSLCGVRRIRRDRAAVDADRQTDRRARRLPARPPSGMGG